jgi:hypothetical protein
MIQDLVVVVVVVVFGVAVLAGLGGSPVRHRRRGNLVRCGSKKISPDANKTMCQRDYHWGRKRGPQGQQLMAASMGASHERVLEEREGVGVVDVSLTLTRSSSCSSFVQFTLMLFCPDDKESRKNSAGQKAQTPPIVQNNV